MGELKERYRARAVFFFFSPHHKFVFKIEGGGRGDRDGEHM